jgi:hypothetical protein
MADVKSVPLGRQARAVAAAGTVLWLFLRAASWMAGSPSPHLLPLLELGIAITIAGVLLSIHCLENTHRARRAAGVGALLSIVPMAAILGAGDAADAFGIAAVRSAVLAVGVVAASVAVFRLARLPAE